MPGADASGVFILLKKFFLCLQECNVEDNALHIVKYQLIKI